MRFCPRCGKKNIKGDYCGACTLIVNPFPREWKRLEMTFCSRCRSALIKNIWSPTKDIEATIRKEFTKRLKLGPDVDVTPILDDLKTGPGVTQQIEVEVKAPRHGLYAIPMTVAFTICTKCSKVGTQYFEGILQLRTEGELREEVIEATRNEIAKYAERGVHCTKQGHVRGGMDFLLTSQKHVQAIGRRLHEQFGGILKINSQLFSRSRETSRDLFRVNVLLELPTFMKGDVVDVDGRLVKVTKAGKKLIGDDLIYGKGVTLDYRRSCTEVVEPRKTTVSKAYPRVEVLDPETYQPVPVENPGKQKPGDKVRVVEHKGKYWIV